MRRSEGAKVAVAGVVALALGASVLVWSGSTHGDTARAALVSSALPTVTVPAPAAAVDAAAVVPVDRCARTGGRTVVVDLSEQQMWLCRRGATVTSSPVTTGSDAHATPTGRWSVYAKETDRWLSGEGYSRQVDYWMPFSGGFGFHDSAWQEIPYGSARVHDDGSHGCVHVPATAMKRLYHWADVGTKVRITA